LKKLFKLTYTHQAEPGDFLSPFMVQRGDLILTPILCTYSELRVGPTVGPKRLYDVYVVGKHRKDDTGDDDDSKHRRRHDDPINKNMQQQQQHRPVSAAIIIL
jgi:hypothetical protein